MRFYGTLIGPEGGQTYKSGARSLEADLRHDSVKVRIEIQCFLVAGVPHVRITAFGEDSRAVFYDGPIATAADSLSPFLSRNLDPARITDQFCGCGRPLQGFEIDLGGCTACAGQAPVPAAVACEDCGGKGWEIFNEDEYEQVLGEVQRCDLCKVLPGDWEAFEAARAAGLEVDSEGLVTGVPADTVDHDTTRVGGQAACSRMQRVGRVCRPGPSY